MKEVLIDHKTRISKALGLFDKLGGKCLYVIKKNKFLVGSLTDGDWRRASIKGKNKKLFVNQICNKNPIKLTSHINTKNIKKYLDKYNLDSIPLVNSKNIIIKIFFKNNLTKKKKLKKITTPLVIMAGGKGTRLSPFTQVLPKPLIPIKGKTVISRIVENFMSSGFRNFYISINEKSKIIKSYFEEKQFKNEIRFLEENKPLGTVGALSKLKKIKSKNFFVTNCDTIINCDVSKILNYHNKSNNSLTILTVKKNYFIPYGICNIDKKNQLISMSEKPKISYLINIGSYVISRSSLYKLKKDKRYDLNEFIKILEKNKMKIGIYRLSEKNWKDVGTWDEYKKTISLIKL